jgi:non-ribosomal peptide synthetase component E (peptide arylation enzyme)
LTRYQIGDYHETYRTFRLDAPERFNWAYEVFDRWAEDSSKLAMLWVSHEGSAHEVTYQKLATRSKRVANVLKGPGAGPGDRIFIMLPRIVEWWEMVLGVHPITDRIGTRDDHPNGQGHRISHQCGRSKDSGYRLGERG